MRILIVKLSSLGDVIQTIPVVADVLRAFPQAEIDWVVEEAFVSLVRRVQGVQRAIPIAQRRWRKARSLPAHVQEREVFFQALRQESYDAVIDFQGLVKSAWVARKARLTPNGFSATFGNASEACSYEWPVRWLLQRSYPMPRRIHAVARYRTLAQAALGCSMDGAPSYNLQVNKASREAVAPTVVLAHGTTRPDNEWPEDAWVSMAQRLADQGISVSIPQSSDQEAQLAQRIKQRVDTYGMTLGIPVVADVWPRMSLESLMDCMSCTHGVIGVDSGLSHLAVALNLPHVQIFSQPRAWRAGPVGQSHQVAVGGLEAPSVEEVWQAWQSVTRACS